MERGSQKTSARILQTYTARAPMKLKDAFQAGLVRDNEVKKSKK